MAEMLEKPELRTNTSTEILVDHLYNWMLSDTPVLERVLETVTALPTSIVEIRRPELSHACHEYLMRMADLVGYTGIRRVKIRVQLKELIQELLN